MFIKKTLITAVTALALANATALSQNLGTIVFQKGENGFDTYRIPSVVQTQSGAVLAFAEARKHSRSDTGDIDLVLKRSEDGGKTWSGIITVWDDGANVCGNPCPVIIRETGRIVLLSTWNHGEDHEKDIHARTSKDTRRVFSMYSDDEGLTWSAPTEITASAKLPEWTWYATGPCHAIQTRSGRIVVPCNHGVYDNGPAGTHSHVIYSDDQGQTWHIGGSPYVGNESTITELDNGDLLLNMRGPRDPDRVEKYGAARLAAISHDGGITFEEPYYEKALIEPVCNASITDYSPDGEKTGKVIFSNPETRNKRRNLTIRMSSDSGKTWERVYTVTEGPTAYSDLVVLKGGDVGCLYESGINMSYEYISWQRIPKKIFYPEPDLTIMLYPEGQDKNMGIVENGRQITDGPGESNGITRPEEKNRHGNVSFVSDSARIRIYLPHKPNGQMVIVCPGGGYSTVCARKEGEDVAKWMGRRGIATCVVTYRLPNGHQSAPLTDVQNAFRYCRAHAQEWGVTQIGVMGFSAGGHLAAMASNLYTDDITKPDFSILIYPVIDLNDHEGTCTSLVGGSKKLKKQYNMASRVTEDTPRTFLALSRNDKVVDPGSSISYFDNLRACGVMSEMYIFPAGGHGWGFLNEEILGRKDGLGTYRPLFSACLDSFLRSVRQ